MSGWVLAPPKLGVYIYIYYIYKPIPKPVSFFFFKSNPVFVLLFPDSLVQIGSHSLGVPPKNRGGATHIGGRVGDS